MPLNKALAENRMALQDTVQCMGLYIIFSRCNETIRCYFLILQSIPSTARSKEENTSGILLALVY